MPEYREAFVWPIVALVLIELVAFAAAYFVPGVGALWTGSAVALVAIMLGFWVGYGVGQADGNWLEGVLAGLALAVIAAGLHAGLLGYVIGGSAARELPVAVLKGVTILAGAAIGAGVARAK